jgi:hypothetical protein
MSLDGEAVPRPRDRREGIAGAVGPDQPAAGPDRLRAAQGQRGDERPRVLAPAVQPDELPPGLCDDFGGEVCPRVRAADVPGGEPGMGGEPRELGQERGVQPGRRNLRACGRGHGVAS